MDEQARKQFDLWEASALLFRRAGGIVSLETFFALTPEKQAALARAGDRHTATLAALIGFASQGQEQVQSLMSFVEGKRGQQIDLRAAIRLMLNEFKAKGVV